MSTTSARDRVGLLLSGGLDSAILLWHLRQTGCRVQPLYVRSRTTWEEAELAAARALCAAVSGPRVSRLVEFDLPLADVYGDHWSLTGRGTPDARTSDEAVYLPGRNPLLLIKPIVYCQLHGIAKIALAPLRSNPFPDATAEFFDGFERAMSLAIDSRITVLRPFAELDKVDVMRLGRGAPLHLTFSCISPEFGLHCGGCNKCAERQRAFRLAGMPDPTRYVRSREVALK